MFRNFGLMPFHSARRVHGAAVFSLLVVLALSACGQNPTAAQTPTVKPPTLTPTPTPKPANAFTYAFARDGQVWVAQAGKAAAPLSQLPDSSGTSITSLAWSPDSKHLAFERKGAGNPVDYVIDTSTGALTVLNVPSTQQPATFGWADNKTVLVFKQVGGNTNVWKEDITSNASSQITQITGTPEIEVRAGSIYYAMQDSNTNQLMLHQYDVAVGTEGSSAAITPAGTSTLTVNWDVSPDGSHVVMGFNMTTPDTTWDNGFWYINFNSNSDRTQIFVDSEIPFSSFKAGNPITLSFSPDGQTVVLDTQNGPGPVSDDVADTTFQTYTPAVGISSPSDISWAPNGVSFALTSSSNNSTQTTIYTLNSQAAGSSFINNASLLTWAPQS
jgi:Tol biopolymer transport system component